eukprot:scaffold2681_cov139-Isochrysis_galbana.AAC.3
MHGDRLDARRRRFGQTPRLCPYGIIRLISDAASLLYASRAHLLRAGAAGSLTATRQVRAGLQIGWIGKSLPQAHTHINKTKGQTQSHILSLVSLSPPAPRPLLLASQLLRLNHPRDAAWLLPAAADRARLRPLVLRLVRLAGKTLALLDAATPAGGFCRRWLILLPHAHNPHDPRPLLGGLHPFPADLWALGGRRRVLVAPAAGYAHGSIQGRIHKRHPPRHSHRRRRQRVWDGRWMLAHPFSRLSRQGRGRALTEIRPGRRHRGGGRCGRAILVRRLERGDHCHRVTPLTHRANGCLVRVISAVRRWQCCLRGGRGGAA